MRDKRAIDQSAGNAAFLVEYYCRRAVRLPAVKMVRHLGTVADYAERETKDDKR